MKQQGFTVIELLVAVVLVAVTATFLLIQRADLLATQRDSNRKTAINAMYYALEEAFYKQHSYYPTTISTDNLPTIDPNLFTDPNGRLLGTDGSDYYYEGLGCDGNTCSGYKLTADLENEADYTKQDRD